MVLDSSAPLAILLSEPEAPRMVRAIGAASTRLVGVPTLVETAAVMPGRKGGAGAIALDALVLRMGIKAVEMDEDTGRPARLAYARSGKGVGYPGVLNFGDCLAHGVAMAGGEPLLFTGTDFAQTDVEAAAW
ncbi:MAG TPA: type II toxin-antitoxin system VapC family toxin [Longimicrobiales bacterium]|nr:type II toxin-antitoxin system VapC family toxin [Longimicrobiales bacterium]